MVIGYLIAKMLIIEADFNNQSRERADSIWG